VVTIKDVAREAGVSSGTVSNVLNQRGRVSSERVKRVREAIRKLGYTPDATARSLKTSCSMNIGVILPNITDPNFAQIFTGIERVLSEHGYTTALYSTSEIPAKEGLIIERVCQQRMDGVIIVTCQPKKVKVFQKFERAKVKTVFLEREVQNAEYNYLGYNNYRSLYNVTSKYLREDIEDIFLITGPSEYSSETQCISGYRDAYVDLQRSYDEARLRETNFNKESAFKAAIELLKEAIPPAVFITSSTQILEGVIKAISFLEGMLQEIPQLVTLDEDTWTDSACSNARKIPRKAIQLGELAAETLLENIKNPVMFEYVHRTVDNGNLEEEPLKESFKATVITNRTTRPLRILMLDDSAMYATSALLPDFIRKTGIQVTIDLTPEYDQQYNTIIRETGTATYDVFQVDSPWFQELAETGSLADLNPFIEKHLHVINDYIPGILEIYSRYQDRYFALPYTFATQLLFYRKDLFENPELRQRFKKHYHSDLQPPKTWKEFNAIARFFTKSYTPESLVQYGTTLGGSPSGVVCEFLSRQWAYGGRTFDADGNFVLNSKETLRALQNYTESYNYASKNSIDYWWDEQVEEFSRGLAAMMIMFVTCVSAITDRTKSKVVGKIGYAMVPGGNPVLGGWSLAINNNSHRKEEAFQFISWVSCRELAIPHTIMGGATPSIHLYKSSELLTIYPWLSKALESFAVSRKRSVSKLTTHDALTERGYERILAEVIREAITQHISPEAAIQSATEKIKQVLEC
jgi:DNA-binding LacI/PurR family transcriptional regulator/ABC-type glycerol-3-phosphate transport system substrate-binding protein